MATYYGVNAGGNWATAGTWSTTATKDASRTGGASAPTNADDCVLDDYSGNVTVNTTSCVAKTLSCVVNGNYAGTLTFTSGQTLTVSGNVTFSSTMTLSGTGNLTINGASATLTSAGIASSITNLRFTASVTLHTNGTTWNNIAAANNLQTWTLSSNLNCSGTLISSVLSAFAGAFDVSCGTLLYINTGGNSLNLVAGQTLSVSTAIYIGGGNTSGSSGCIIRSATASSDAYLVYNGTRGNCQIAQVKLTDINATGSTQNLDTFCSTLTRCTNITDRTPSDYATASQAAKILDDTTISGVTGTIPTQTLSAANDTVSAGYYAATTLSAVDTDLAAGNIISGKTIFGINGNASGGGSVIVVHGGMNGGLS
jgi:hypothetical protein